MKMTSMLMAVAVGMLAGTSWGAHVHLYVDANGTQLSFQPSAGSFNVVDGKLLLSEQFAATGVPDAYLPGIAVSAPTITTLENFGQASSDIVNHEVGIRITSITAVSGSPTTTLTWLITAPPKDAGVDEGNLADQTITASIVPDGSGGYTSLINGTIDLGPLDNGVPTGNHWHGQHWAFSDPGVYNVSFQLFDLNASNGLAATYGVFADSPVYTVQFVSTPEPASLGLLGLGTLALLGRRRR